MTVQLPVRGRNRVRDGVHADEPSAIVTTSSFWIQYSGSRIPTFIGWMTERHPSSGLPPFGHLAGREPDLSLLSKSWRAFAHHEGETLIVRT